MPLDGRHQLALVKGVIAQRHHIGARIAQQFKMGLGDAAPVAGILAIDDDEIEPAALDQARKPLGHHIAAGPAHHVPQKQKPHASSKRRRPVSVTRRSSGRS